MSQTQPQAPQELIAPLAIGIDNAAIAIGVARSAMYAIVARGDIASFKVGRRRLILAKTLEAYINRVAKEQCR